MEKQILILDSTQIVEFLTCPTMHYYSNTRNIVSITRNTKALDIGTIIHGLLERYYHWKIDHGKVESIDYATAALHTSYKDLGLETEEYQFITQRFLAYCTHYLLNDFEPIVWEGRPAIEVGFSVPIVDNDQHLFILEGRIDLIAKQNDLIWLVDHKSQERIYDYYKESIQFKNYCLATGVNHFVVNYFGLQKGKNDWFRRSPIYFSNYKLKAWKEHLISIFKTVLWSKNSGCKPYQNWAACPGKYGPCQYTTLCELEDEKLKENMIPIYYKDKPEWKPWTDLEVK